MAEPQPKQLNHRFFDVGTKWKHKRQKAIYFIRAKGKDEFGTVQHTLGLFDPQHHHGVAFFSQVLVWTAEDILREFDPVDPHMTRYDRLMLDE